jgi:hypothetical protein
MFKKLKSLFVIEEEGGAQSADQAKSTASASDQPSKAGAPAPTATGYDKNNPPKGKPQEKFVNRLLGALEENNPEGFDYLEYKQAVQNLSNVDMDEATRFKSALAMAKSMGATPQKLVGSAEGYLKILAKEEAKFLDAFKNQTNKKVNAQAQEIKRLEDGIKQRQAQITKLQKEIEAGTKALEANKKKMNQSNAKVQATKDGFYVAYHIVTQQISEDIAKMKQHLP